MQDIVGTMQTNINIASCQRCVIIFVLMRQYVKISDMVVSMTDIKVHFGFDERTLK